MQRAARYLGLAACLAAAPLVLAEAPTGRPEPRFPQREASSAPLTRPSVPGAPSELVPVRPTATRRAAAARIPEEQPAPDSAEAGRTRPGGGRSPGDTPPPPSDATIERHGLDAGASVAETLAGSEGRIEAYRVGVWEGQRQALADPLPARFAYEAGLRSGRWDPEARHYGASAGEAEAAERAARDAPLQVERQFLDLERTPVRSPLASQPEWSPAFDPTPAPELAPLFAAYPPARAPGVPRRFPDGFAGWGWTPSKLHGCKQWRDFSHLDWQDPDRAFRLWLDDARRSAFYRGLPTRRARALLEASFADGFLDRLPWAYDRFVAPSFADGFSDGWMYGAFLHAEWSFRRGYAEGFDEGMALAAQIAYERAYPEGYAQAYDAAFFDWAGSARPGILSAWVKDANDDGVFEPGESLELEVELANFGGTAGSFELTLEGRAMTASAGISVQLPARQRVRPPAPLAADIAESVRVPSSQSLVLRIGSERRDLPVLVSFPMEFTGNIGYDSQPLLGRARVRFEVTNRSRKPVEGVAVLRDAERRELGAVEPGARREAEFVLDDLRPLDLISGALAVPASVTVSGKVHDRRTARFPELATQLANPALVEYLVRLGHEQDPDLRDVQQARRLTMQRLEVDWRVRCEEDGNAYQADLSEGTARTALGELVRAYDKERSVLGRSVAFHGLDVEIRDLAETLAGVHPNLRRSMKKLAARIDD